MNRINTFILVSLFCLSAIAQSVRSDLDVHFVTDLPNLEVYEGHLFHAGVLWVGRSRVKEHEKHQVEVYSADGQSLLTSIPTDAGGRNHTVSFIYPYDAQSVIVVGKSQWPWKTHFAIMTYRNGKISSRPYTFPEAYQVEQFGGDPSKMFFTEVGSRSILRHRNGSSKALDVEISGPGKTLLLGNSLWVLERKSFYMGDENIVKVDLGNETGDRTFKDYLRQGLVDIYAYDAHTIAAAELLANQVLLIDADTNKLRHTLNVPEPRGLAKLGQCLVTTSEESRLVRFYDLHSSPPSLVDEWDLSSLSTRFKKARKVEVNPTNGRLYLRSTYLCSGCAETMSSVITVKQNTNEVFNRCVKGEEGKDLD